MPEKQTATESSRKDRVLVDAALSGDQQAYHKLVDKYQRALYYHILKLVRNRDVVDDLVQEAFSKAFDCLDTYNRSYAFSTWIYRIATNHTIDYLRKKKLQTLSIDEPVQGKDGEMKIEIADEGSQSDREIIRKQRKEMVRSAIESLPEKYRIVVRMRHMQEMSYEEISEELDLPLGTVKAHIFRARELLNKHLKDRLTAY
ncbi:sigma-70 family RNA polymerase sigma factor [Natronogracilivirga saccharolytica]|uniref:Sigma-70 family RNA polymerase sigma factor n=1 Tax=Natronogracilivirga saccharolytica TaxID=2812953 RepID=A0A8J7UV57_9BACT|nr:sigma-70 family RNA polymerase sigma factor [Natronogracilivirga saccharolytica]